jgi:hypothetical protein
MYWFDSRPQSPIPHRLPTKLMDHFPFEGCPVAYELAAFADGSLERHDPGRAASIAAHIAGCEACGDSIRNIPLLPATMGAGVSPVSPDLTEGWKSLMRERIASAGEVPEVGEVWLTTQRWDPSDLDSAVWYALILERFEQSYAGRWVVNVAPAREGCYPLADWSYSVDGDQSGWGEDLSFDLDFAFTATEDLLVRRLTTLPKTCLADVRAALDAAQAGDEAPPAAQHGQFGAMWERTSERWSVLETHLTDFVRAAAAPRPHLESFPSSDLPAAAATGGDEPAGKIGRVTQWSEMFGTGLGGLERPIPHYEKLEAEDRGRALARLSSVGELIQHVCLVHTEHPGHSTWKHWLDTAGGPSGVFKMLCSVRLPDELTPDRVLLAMKAAHVPLDSSTRRVVRDAVVTACTESTEAVWQRAARRTSERPTDR